MDALIVIFRHFGAPSECLVRNAHADHLHQSRLRTSGLGTSIDKHERRPLHALCIERGQMLQIDDVSRIYYGKA